MPTVPNPPTRLEAFDRANFRIRMLRMNILHNMESFFVIYFARRRLDVFVIGSFWVEEEPILRAYLAGEVGIVRENRG
jgi:hypothetical protein